MSEAWIDVNQKLIDYVMINCKDEILKNEELYTLITDYFHKTNQMLEFFLVLEEFFNHTRYSRSQLIVSASTEPENECCRELFQHILQDITMLKQEPKRYENFCSLYQSIRTRQLALQDRIETRRELLDKSLGLAEFRFTMFAALNITAFVLCFVGSVLEVFLNASKEVSVAITFTFPFVDIFTRRMRSHFNNKKKRLRDEYNIIAPMHVAFSAMTKHVGMGEEQVYATHTKIHALINSEVPDLSEDEGMMIACAAKELKKKYDDFFEAFQALRKYAAECTSDIKKARAQILKQIINYRGTAQTRHPLLRRLNMFQVLS